jgi:lipopolysaccharide biosynthesis regulator YciM
MRSATSKTAIRIGDQIKAMGVKGQACLALGRLYHHRGKNDLAARLIKESISQFKQLGADRHLKQATSAWDALGIGGITSRAKGSEKIASHKSHKPAAL